MQASGADFSWASLEGAELSGALLENATFEGAYLVGASLNWALVEGANFRNAIGAAEIDWSKVRGTPVGVPKSMKQPIIPVSAPTSHFHITANVPSVLRYGQRRPAAGSTGG